MARDHIVPRFLLARWADPVTGCIEVADLEARQIRSEDPAEFYKFEDFNTITRPDGTREYWLEREFLAGLDDSMARSLKRLENIQPPRVHLKAAKKSGWHLNHLTSPRMSVRIAMFVAAQAVRSPVWRQALSCNTAAAMKRHVEERVTADLSQTTDPKQRAELEKLLGLRYYADVSDAISVPHLSGHLAYRIGEILYRDYLWAIHRFEDPLLMLGDDPVLILNYQRPDLSGSYSQVATAKDAALSLYASREESVERAVAVMQDNDRVFVALGPRHLLVLSRVKHLWPAGRYDQKRPAAAVVNTLLMKASRRWVCSRPGSKPPIVSLARQKLPRPEQPNSAGSADPAES